MTQEEFFKRYTYNVSHDYVGGGHFGKVYKAYDNVLHREVAIKVSEVTTSADGKKTFSLKDEFEALNHVPKHPNIANYEEYYSFEMPNGIFDYAVMQYYPDGNLSNAIKQGLTAEQKEDVAIQLLEGIAFLHQHKVVHRDLKPGNILIVKHDGKVAPLITDFGLSKAAGVVDGSVFSNSYGAGTPKYSSPEQLQGKPLRFNTDLWSYGAILYELFTGSQLFTASSGVANTAQADMEIYNKIVNGNVESLGKMPEKWRRVAERCLVVDAAKRSKSANELYDIIKADVADDDDTEVTESPIRKPSDKETKWQLKDKSATKLSDSVSKPNKRITLWIALGLGVVAVVAILVVFFKLKPFSSYHEESADEIVVGEFIEDFDELSFTVNGVRFKMKRVEGGMFKMGSNDIEASSDEKPIHSVALSSFFMAETEVPRALWSAVMDDNTIKKDSIPVSVSWYDAAKFCNELSIRCGRKPYYTITDEEDSNSKSSYDDVKCTVRIDSTGNGFRLPTEAEWEFAAKGGNMSRGYKYSGSNDLDEVGWYFRNSGDEYLIGTYDYRNWDNNNNYKSHPVKTKLPNELGLYDMCGNLSEWCFDWYTIYSSKAQVNPIGQSFGWQRVIRGGSYYDTETACRTSSRNHYTPHWNCGVRFVLPEKP